MGSVSRTIIETLVEAGIVRAPDGKARRRRGAGAVRRVGRALRTDGGASHLDELIDPRRQKIIQVDIDPRNAGWVFPVDIGLTGDARLVMRQLIGSGRCRPGRGAAWLTCKAGVRLPSPRVATRSSEGSS